MIQRIFIQSHNIYLNRTVATLLNDLGYQIVNDLHQADALITDQISFLYIKLPTIYIYAENIPSIECSKECILIEQPASIQSINDALKQLEKKGSDVQTARENK